MRKKEKRKGSIQSPKDLGIALGTFGVALVVITMIKSYRKVDGREIEKDKT